MSLVSTDSNLTVERSSFKIILWDICFNVLIRTSKLGNINDLIRKGFLMETLQNLLDQSWQWSGVELILTFVILLSTFVIRWVIKYLMERVAARLARITTTQVDDMLVEAIKKPIEWVILILGLYLAIYTLHPPDFLMGILKTGFWVPFSVLTAWMIFRCVNVFTLLLKNWAQKTDTTLDDHLIPLVERSIQIMVWILAALMILQNLGYSVSGLLAGMGIGGLAIALAAQKTLADVFGSIMLLIDRPFVAGDWIVSPDREIEGVVESVGFRSTRIRTFEQTLIAIPNNRLAEFVIDNISSRPHRRVWLKVGLTFDTPSESMREAVMQIERLLRNHPDVSQESTLLVRFNEITDESLEIMVYYFTATTVWADYLRIREDINLRVIEVIESLGLRLAFPTRTVHVANGFLKGDEK